MQPLHIKTPLLQSQYLKNKLNKQVHFKLEGSVAKALFSDKRIYSGQTYAASP